MRWRSLLLVLGLFACGDDDATMLDSGTDGGELCETVADCSDGVFCNGLETCSPMAPSADARGCVAALGIPCLASQTCDEEDDLCESDCDMAPDADGDGHDAAECGGDDCDDSNSNRFPGNTEVCDEDGIDEDCDSETLGGPESDIDEDGVPSDRCCNVRGSEIRCGLDCDDARASVRPGAGEICNGFDDDCDGRVDEGVETLQYADFDLDGFGNPAIALERECDDDPRWTTNSDDCNDLEPAMHPGAEEICDGLDNDCDGDPNDDIDVDRDGFLDPRSACANGGETIIDRTLRCADSEVRPCDCNDLDPLVYPGSPERCNGIDDDCDEGVDGGGIDEGGFGEGGEPLGADAACATVLGERDALGYCGTNAEGEAGCVALGCEEGRADCDRSDANGCETILRNDPDNCGGCGVICRGECRDGFCDDGCPECAPPGLSEVIAIAIEDSRGCRIRRALEAEGDEGVLECWGEIGSLPLGARPLPLSDGSGIIHDARQVAISDGWVWFTRGDERALWGIGGAIILSARPMRSEAGDVIFGVVEMDSRNEGLCLIRGEDEGELWCTSGEGSAAFARINAPDGGFSNPRIGGQTTGCALRGGALLCGPIDGSMRWDSLSLSPALSAGCSDIDLRGDDFVFGLGDCSPLDGTTGGSDTVGVLPAGLSHSAPYRISETGGGSRIECVGLDSHLYCGAESSPFASDMLNCSDGEVRPDRLACDETSCLPSGASCSRGPTLHTEISHFYPQLRPRVSITSGFEAIDAGSSDQLSLYREAGCVIDEGRVLCFGQQERPSQVAVGPELYGLPAPQRGLALPVEISHSGRSACARRADGSGACWGAQLEVEGAGEAAVFVNTHSLSQDESELLLAPVELPMQGIRDLEVGPSSTCAIVELPSSAAELQCWGVIAGRSDTPVTVSLPGDARPVAVSVGGTQACALDTEGLVYCWGRYPGRISDGPEEVPMPGGVRAVQIVATGGRIVNDLEAERAFCVSEPYACALLVTGEVACWGGNTFGVLGPNPSAEPGAAALVTGIEDATHIDINTVHACATLSDGRVMCWGGDPAFVSRSDELCGGEVTEECPGQPTPTIPCSRAPYAVRGVSDAVVAKAGLGGGCVLRRNGSVSCWGINAGGIAGDGTRLDRPWPSSNVRLPGIAQSIEVGFETACAILANGDVWCWGADSLGQRGDGFLSTLHQEASGDVDSILVPSAVPGL